MTNSVRNLTMALICAWPMFISGSYAAEAEGLTIANRTIPLPAAASDDLRAVIAASSNAIFSSGGQVPETSEEWEAFVAIRTPSNISLDAIAQNSGMAMEAETIAGVTVYHVIPDEIAPEHQDHVFVYYHGGGYILGGGPSSVSEASVVARAAGIRAISADYRMPPAHPFPAAVDDAVAVYRELLTRYDADAIALGGTSAGAGLTLAVVHQAKTQGLPLPGALYLGTPWADLTDTSDTLHTNDGIDRVLGSYYDLMEAAALLYADGADLKNPLISPLYGEFDGFPPAALFSGTRDLLLSDTARVHRAIREAGGTADLHVFEGVSHADYLFIANSPESRAQYGELSQFLKTHLR